MKEKIRKSSLKINIARTAAAVMAAVFAVGSIQWTPVNATGIDEVPSDGNYYLADYGSSTVLNSYSTFKYADKSYEALKDQYDNLAIVKDAKIYKAEYAIASISSTDACDYNVLFSNDLNGQSNYTNGCYGKDAAYLDTDDSGEKAEFYLSGVKGWADIDDIEIIPVQNISTRLSGYAIDSGNLFHHIKSTMEEDNYASILNVGTAPAYLSEGVSYYSYDGHYFYTQENFVSMIDDLRNDVRTASVNPNDPYYNYYQYISNRTLTNVSYEQIEALFEDSMGIDALMDTYNDNNKDSADDTLNRSQYYDTAQVFYQNQYQYGANALMMISLSANESAFGRSSLSFTRNNLFGHAAYDNDVEKNASRYLSTANSIYSHAKYYISGSYCYPGKTFYHGGFFGNKSAGMNVSYASDPYWGEKAAYYYRMLDEALGYADRDAYTVGIKTSAENISIYQYPNEDSTVLYQTSKMPDYAFVILREFSDDSGEWYAVQSDATLDDQSGVALEYDYDFENDIGYIRKDAVQILLNPDSHKEVQYVNVTFDGDGGEFSSGESIISYKLPSGSDAACSIPQKDHALFTGWDKELSAISEDTVFTAQYKDTESIAIETMPETEYETNDRINLKDGTIRIQYTDGTSIVTALTTSMISGFDLSQDGQQTVTVSYAGCSTQYEISVSAEKDAQHTEIKNAIVGMIEQYKDTETLSNEDIESILSLKSQIDEQVQPYLNQAQLRDFDSILRKSYQEKIRYIVKDNTVNLGGSGLCLSFPLGDSLEKNQIFPDTYRVSYKNSISADAKKLLNKVCKGQNDEASVYFKITITKNGETVHSEKPLVFSMDIPENSAEDAYFTVYYYDSEDGDITECYTLQSDSAISFMAYGTGEYLLAYRRTSNTYAGIDPAETVTAESSSSDMQKTIALCTAATVLAAAAIVILLYLKKRKRRNEILKRHQIRQTEEKTEADNDQHND